MTWPSQRVLHYFRQGTHVGVFAPTSVGVLTVLAGRRGYGDCLQLQVTHTDSVPRVVTRALFQAYGSCATIACGAFLCEYLSVNSVALATALEVEWLVQALALQPNERYAALLALDAWNKTQERVPNE